MSENGPKRCQKATKTAQYALTPRNQARTVSWATWLKIRFRGHLVHPQPPTFCGCQPSEWPNETRRPRTSGHLVQSEGSPARARRGPTVGPPGSPGRKKSFFPKLFPDHLGCSNTCFWPVLSPWWRVLGHQKSQNALKMGRFKTKNGSKMGEKRVFPKVILDHFGCSNTCFWPVLSPWWRVLGHGKSENALKMGRFKTKNGSKMGQKRVFPKVILDHFGCSNTI